MESVNRAAAPCPRCAASDAVVPLRYGFPTAEVLGAARQGRLRLGGCLVCADYPA
jgi:hypothetical protein